MKYYSVTQVLSPFSDFSHVPADRLSYAAERGKTVHAACHAYAKGLWIPPLPEDHDGFFLSFKKWFDSYVTDVIWAEKELKNDVYGFLGHPDICCKIRSAADMVIDYKTPAAEQPTWKCQVAAYCDLAGVEHGAALKLHANGNPATAIVYQRTLVDFAVFLSALNAYRYFKG